VKAWVSQEWEKWQRERPKFFSLDLIARIPESVLSEDMRAEILLQDKEHSALSHAREGSEERSSSLLRKGSSRMYRNSSISFRDGVNAAKGFVSGLGLGLLHGGSNKGNGSTRSTSNQRSTSANRSTGSRRPSNLFRGNGKRKGSLLLAAGNVGIAGIGKRANSLAGGFAKRVRSIHKSSRSY
jgi:hypothetical protein